MLIFLQMVDQRYEYPRINVVKIIVHCTSTNKILLLQEPSTNEWMPNHWGLPGGKPLKNESLFESIDRKVKTDIGSSVRLKGLLRLEELIQEDKTILMFIFVAEVVSEINPKGEAKNSRWISLDEIQKMKITEFTEFYNPWLIRYFFDAINKIVPFEFIDTRNYNQISKDLEYQEWLTSSKKT